MILANIWFLIISILIMAYAILEGTFFGVGFWHIWNRNLEIRENLIKITQPFWDGNGVWLIVSVGALFAAFPAVYASILSSFYFFILFILLGIIFRISAIEFRSKISNIFWQKICDYILFLGSFITPFCFGLIFGNLIKGISLDSAGFHNGNWLEFFNLTSLSFAFCVVFMFAYQGACFLILSKDESLHLRSIFYAKNIWYFYLLFSVFSLIVIFISSRYSVLNWSIRSLLFIIFLILSYVFLRQNKFGKAYFSSLLSTINLLFMVLWALYPQMVPAKILENSLTLYNSSSSNYTLIIMLIIAIVGMPAVFLYTLFIYRVFLRKIISY